jgi:starch synthase
MDILFAATELFPLLKVGGLADYAAALPRFTRHHGHCYGLVLPRFRTLDTSALRGLEALPRMRLRLGERTFEVGIFRGRLAAGLDVFLVEAGGLFDRPGVYGEGGKDYADNGLRFALFSRVVAELLLQRAQSGSPVDILHLNDWHTALAATYLEGLRREDARLARTRSVLTIHNLAHQGIFERALFDELGLETWRFSIDGIEFHGKLSFLKQAILSADAITTVSETYAREIQSPEYGCGLEGVLQGRAHVLRGITNGIDEEVWNPGTDAALPVRYDAGSASQRARCRAALQAEVGLPVDANALLLGSVGRIVAQKGSDVLAEALPDLVRSLGAQVVIAGDGDPALMERISRTADDLRGAVAFVRFASEELVHRILAGADAMLLPSRFEPCGLVQMYAQRYGALPIARATGGFVDTIEDHAPGAASGTGFLFEACRADALLGAAARAALAKKSPQWPELVERAMRLDHGWSASARRYDEVYRGLGG